MINHVPKKHIMSKVSNYRASMIDLNKATKSHTMSRTINRHPLCHQWVVKLNKEQLSKLSGRSVEMKVCVSYYLLALLFVALSLLIFLRSY